MIFERLPLFVRELLVDVPGDLLRGEMRSNRSARLGPARVEQRGLETEKARVPLECSFDLAATVRAAREMIGDRQ
jgi:hypothetical protein